MDENSGVKNTNEPEELTINQQTNKVSWTRELLDWVIHIGIAAGIAIFISTFVMQLTVVNGDSMQPTLQPSNWLVLEKITTRLSTPQRGQIVVIDAIKQLGENNQPTNHNPLIKRVVGIEGDKIELRDGKVFLNNTELKELYINGNETPESGNYSLLTVQPGEVYVMGDNRKPSMSLDSRILGTFPISAIKGHAVFRLFPFTKLGVLH